MHPPYEAISHYMVIAHYNMHCVKSVQIRSFFWSVFSRIRTEYGAISYLSVFSPNTGKCRPERTTHLATFREVMKNFRIGYPSTHLSHVPIYDWVSRGYKPLEFSAISKVAVQRYYTKLAALKILEKF